jgi:putative NIF3 family GTP cyclohydrolase 1 type 2
VIPHEPTWYNHYDHVEHLQGDAVYEAKMRFLEDTGMVIWRFHDYSHRMKPDVIIRGVVRRLGYEDCQGDPDDDRLYDIPAISFEDLVQRCKTRLGIPYLKVVGDPGTNCRRVAIFVGWGSAGILDDDQVLYLVKKKADVVICGESAEWVTCEYVRDAMEAGVGKGLILLGHAASEEPGTQDVVEWLQPLIPDVKVTFVAAGDPFRFL